jgi:hypothetical protein
VELDPLNVEGVEAPLGPLLMWHPMAEIEELEVPGEYLVAVPTGDAFLVWNPKVRAMHVGSDFTSTTTLLAK